MYLANGIVIRRHLAEYMGGAASVSELPPEENHVSGIVNRFLTETVKDRSERYEMAEDVIGNSRSSSPLVIVPRLTQSDRSYSTTTPATGDTATWGDQPDALRNRSISYDPSLSMSMLKVSTKSLRHIAHRSHSRQSNSYISTKDLLVSSGLLYSHNSGKKITGLIDGSPEAGRKEGSSASMESNSSSGGSVNASESLGPVIKSVSDQKKRVRPNLQISISENKIQDDVDWIQVDDDDEEEEEKPMKPRPSLSLDGSAPLQSYSLTKSGTIFVDGFQGGIGKTGIRTEQKSNLIPLQDRLVFLCRLGSGASGIVYKALDLRDMRLVAIKMIPMFERGKRRQMVRELSALFQILNQKRADKIGRDSKPPEEGGGAIKEPKHYIVDFFDAFSNIDEGGVALMMEYMDGGSLQDIVTEGGCDEEPTLASIAQQALVGLSFLHRCNQLHRDLKPGNFLISKKGEVKIADFGILRQMDEASGGLDAINSPTIGKKSDDEAIPRVQTFVGTATFMSPERIDGREYSYPSDIWSFGLSLLTVAIGKLPINTDGGYWSILQSIRDEKPPSIPEDDERFSDELRDFVSCCCQTKPEDRLTAEQLLKHPFVLKAHEGEALEGDEERGRRELNEIMMATFEHIEKRRAETLNEKLQAEREAEARATDDPVTEEGASEKAQPTVSDSWPLFAEIVSKKNSAMLHNLFFPLDQPESEEFLNELAEQLNLPIATLLADIHAFIENSKSIKTKSNHTPKTPAPPVDIAATPKATHGKMR